MALATPTPKMAVTPFKASERLKSLSETPMYVKALIYGDPGVGKTWLACTVPNPLLVLSEWAVSRLTLERLRRDLGIDPDVIYVESDDDAIEALKYARAHTDKYDSLVLDGITDLNDRIMREVLQEVTLAKEKHDPDILEQRDWNRVLTRTGNVLRLYRDFPGHTVITALATEEMMKIVPLIYPKSLRKMIASMFNFVGYLTAEARAGKPSMRRLHTDLAVAHIAKSPGGFIPPVVENPNFQDLIPQIVSVAGPKQPGPATETEHPQKE